jgi:hypothetical protein
VLPKVFAFESAFRDNSHLALNSTLLSRKEHIPQRPRVSHDMSVSLYSLSDSAVVKVNKQINDKERVAAAMEVPSLRDLVEECLQERDV